MSTTSWIGSGANASLARLTASFFSLAMLFWGCSPQGPTLSDEDRLESVAISSLRYNVPAQVVAAARYSTAVETVQLTNGDWVAELVTIGNPKWDYRRTGSHAFPFEAALALPAQRWITKPCSTKEEAQLASKSNQSFPVDVEDSFSRKYPAAPPVRNSYSGSGGFVAELVYSVVDSRWETKSVVCWSVDVDAGYSAATKALADRFPSAGSASKKESPTAK